jgi:hypothetical protein
MSNLPDDASQIFVAKAMRIAETHLRQRAKPTTRADLVDIIGIIRQRIRTGKDPILTGLGFSAAGVMHFLQTEYGLSADDAQLIADAMCELVRNYNA